jgi:hypothetical protein
MIANDGRDEESRADCIRVEKSGAREGFQASRDGPGMAVYRVFQKALT